MPVSARFKNDISEDTFKTVHPFILTDAIEFSLRNLYGTYIKDKNDHGHIRQLTFSINFTK